MHAVGQLVVVAGPLVACSCGTLLCGQRHLGTLPSDGQLLGPLTPHLSWVLWDRPAPFELHWAGVATREA